MQYSPGVICPYYNGTYYTDAQGVVYYVLCGFDSLNAAGLDAYSKSSEAGNSMSCRDALLFLC